MFVVAGVTGNTGKVVAETLLVQGLPVRVIVRDAAKGEAWKKKGAEVAVADLHDAKALTAALRPDFEVVNAQGQVIASGIVGGDAVAAPAGNHTVRIKGGADAGKPVTVKPKETASVTF